MNTLKKFVALMLFTMFSTPSFAAITDADLFAWAAANYPSLFSGTPTAGYFPPYDYMYYPTSGVYLAVDTSSGTVDIMGPVTGNAITSVGLLTSFDNTVTNWKSAQAGGNTVTYQSAYNACYHGTPALYTSTYCTAYANAIIAGNTAAAANQAGAAAAGSNVGNIGMGGTITSTGTPYYSYNSNTNSGTNSTPISGNWTCTVPDYSGTVAFTSGGGWSVSGGAGTYSISGNVLTTSTTSGSGTTGPGMDTDSSGNMDINSPASITFGSGNTSFTATDSSNNSMSCSKGTSTGGTPTTTPGSALSCPAGNGSGTNGIVFYTPSNYTSYNLSTSSANSNVTSSLNWGVKYNNVNNYTSSSYSGSVRAEIWAVSSSYSGGTITGYKLGTFNPNFTGSGAKSSTQIYVGGYSTSSVNSSGSFTTPPAGNYCIVATLEEYNNQWLTDDWMQFSGSVQFR